MIRTCALTNPAKIGLVALALALGSVALVGPASSPVFASSGGHSGGGGGGGSSGGGSSGGGSSGGGSSGGGSSGGGGSSSGGGSSGHSSGGATGGGSNGSGSAFEAPMLCKKGSVYSKKKGTCVQASSSLLDDKELYEEGRDLALGGHYDEALTALDAVKAPDSMTLTMIGYATRKLGNYDEGLAYYAKALALDPNNVNTHEYLGEAYAEKGKLGLAKAELIKVSAVCGTGCEQYEDLAKAIDGKPAE
jgi:hypothetical protein